MKSIQSKNQSQELRSVVEKIVDDLENSMLSRILFPSSVSSGQL
jgi:hypothetical protein